MKRPLTTRAFVIAFLTVSAVGATLWTLASDLPTQTSSLFAGSGTCVACHQSDGSALVTPGGLDLSPTTRWRATMMANAARDAYWQAKVADETLAFPTLKAVIEDKCTTCHAPMARTQAIHDGADAYALADALADALGRDGVSCTACHQIQPDGLGEPEGFSGGFVINDSRTIFGPYANPMDMMMRHVVNYTSQQGAHLSSAEMCASCHTLYTPYLDDAGEIAGSFPEQTPYLEWKASVYADEERPCQHCHMPEVADPVRIATIPAGLPDRSPFSQHVFVGANVFMLRLLKDNGEEMGVTANPAHFDSTIARTANQLRSRTVALSVGQHLADGVVSLDVKLENLAGHKFPTGFPSRRAWLHVTVKDEGGSVVFESGAYDEDGAIEGLEEMAIEPHHDVIDRPDQVQIYEGRMVDVNGNPTVLLLRGARYAKDNRLPPKGFSRAAEHYEDMAIHGEADADENFNAEAGVEGSGTDQVTYLLDVSSRIGKLSATVDLLYQSIAPIHIDHFSEGQAELIDRFLEQVEDADRAPEMVQTTTVEIDLSSGTDIELVRATRSGMRIEAPYPNPVRSSTVFAIRLSEADAEAELQVFDLKGSLVRTLEIQQGRLGEQLVRWDGRGNDGARLAGGVYVVRLADGAEIRSRTVVLLR